MIRIRDNRDVRGPLCGNVKQDDGTYTHVPPYQLLTLYAPRGEQWTHYFSARLRGAFTTMGELPL